MKYLILIIFTFLSFLSNAQSESYIEVSEKGFRIVNTSENENGVFMMSKSMFFESENEAREYIKISTENYQIDIEAVKKEVQLLIEEVKNKQLLIENLETQYKLNTNLELKKL